MRIAVTGGCGFIGSNFIRYILRRYPSYRVVNLDALTYAGNRDNLRDLESDPRYSFVQGRVEDPETVKYALQGADAVVHFAAESHVDRSILDCQPFLTTNILGTQVVLDVARSMGIERLVHISTDEVYGSLDTDEGQFTEDSPLMPNSPYAASKAGADLLVRSYNTTYGMGVIIVRPSNNYGPYQLPEKFIPLMVTNLIEGKKVPVYGEGKNIRDWLFVEDTCRAIDLILHHGRPSEVYNVGGGNERRNIQVVREVLRLMDRSDDEIEFVPDRPGHDYRYSVSFRKFQEELNWSPQIDFQEGLRLTVQWYIENEWWWRPLKQRLQKESRGFWTAR